MENSISGMACYQLFRYIVRVTSLQSIKLLRFHDDIKLGGSFYTLFIVVPESLCKIFRDLIVIFCHSDAHEAVYTETKECLCGQGKVVQSQILHSKLHGTLHGNWFLITSIKFSPRSASDLQ